MERKSLRIAFFGSSLVSAYWNGAANYYRGIIRALAARGHRVTFYEPDVCDRQEHRDIPDPDYARSIVYPSVGESGVRWAIADARGVDVVVKASGVGVFDELLEESLLRLQTPDTRVIFWDVNVPATLDRMRTNSKDPFRALIPQYDGIFTYGGGNPVMRAYQALGAQWCVPVYNALDPATHYPVSPDERFDGSLGFLGNRLPDREDRLREYLFHTASLLPGHRFLLGGNGWNGDASTHKNVSVLGHVSTRDHNAFNSTVSAVLNVNRESTARYGYSPSTRIFEAAGAGACIITDDWEGIGLFLEPGRECLVARNGAAVAAHLATLTPERAREIGRNARSRVLSEHTYSQRAGLVESVLLDVENSVLA